ncbi:MULTISPECIES: DUF4347 domain-containing protein [Nostoc]|uniref:DUF4347 domain-containing protein n=1 Tax=Nostoc paludosum FACHB-159 TaxID=2692908 RepID=A0ABR8K9Q1_9NOSO|nr:MULTISPECIES: DUF4347 domain-containing protein [Nostoc]MBD2679207.1 DUF4347 domain-containing protein [Nostoc sp. FACHB-857]MBD2735588.1 DUF4347 domain-containing protein [Nostoc paludosum FACHB-159]
MFETNFSDFDNSALVTGFSSSQGLGSNLIPNLLLTEAQLVNPQSIAFVDLSIPEVEKILQGLTTDLIIPLQPEQDSITQITETLSNYDDLLGVHVISHGSSGQLELGNSVVNLETLHSRSQDLETWADALAADADILLYGCNVAAGTVGSTFVSELGQLTGADVAASTDLTGNISQGGNWVLEYATGTIESPLAIQPSLLNTYNGLLAGFDYTNFASTSGLKFNGSSAQFGNALRLTPASASQSGSVFYTTPIALDTNTSFQTQFQFQLTGGTLGADGFTFVLQNSPAKANAKGSSGGNLGYGGTLTPITQSLAIEFDTYKNGTDTNNNSIAVLRDGNVNAALATTSTVTDSNSATPIDLNSGTPINAWIEYNGSTDKLDVFLSQSSTKLPTAKAALSYQIDLTSVLGSQAFVGFTAGTGSRFNAHNINSWKFNSDNGGSPDNENSNGLVGYWKFEEATGNTVLDSSGNNNNGSLINSSRTVGIYGQGLQVSGKNSSHASIPASASLNSITNQITVSAWVRPNAQPVGFQAVVNRQIGTLLHPDQFYLGFGTRNQVTTYKWEIGTTNGEGNVYEGTPTTNRWVHLVGTYDGSLLRLYVDGVQIGSNPVTGNILVDNNPVTIGAAENYGEGTPLGDRFNGLIDEVRIYNRALSATEVKNLK